MTSGPALHASTNGRQPVLNEPPNWMGYYAGFVTRLLAMVIDITAISVSLLSITWFFTVTASMLQLRTILGFSINRIPGSANFIDAIFSTTIAGLFTLVYIGGYHLFFLVLIGQTPGKALMGLRVVTLQGRRLSPWRALLRIAAYLVSGLPLFLGFFWILVDDRRQGWHDKLAGTCVIYTWAARPDENFLAGEIRRLHAPHLLLDEKAGDGAEEQPEQKRAS
jgi:uncharacterized RDD family membrane protein YckC